MVETGLRVQPHDADPQLRISQAFQRFIEGPYTTNCAQFQPVLTSRQREILRTVIVSGGNNAAANVLGLSFETINNHLSNTRDKKLGVYRRLGVNSLVEAMLVATARGELSLSDLRGEIGINLENFRLLDPLKRKILLQSIAQKGDDSNAAIGIRLGLKEPYIKRKFVEIYNDLGVETKAHSMLAAFSFQCTAEFVVAPLRVPPTLLRFSIDSRDTKIVPSSDV
ncbi:MAG: Bacterial regulatory protein luxR family [Candidatus Parcubacteria bacterium]|jgi:DNA-binding CsgD family transcriptional regulator